NGDVDFAWKQVQKRINTLKRRKNTSTVLKYAAVLVISLGISISFLFQEKIVVMPDDQIVLELSDGTKKIIKSDGSQEIVGSNGTVLGKQDAEGLSYADATSDDELAYNTLYIPYSKRFKLVLSDGTKIHLNSGTTLKYPVKFLKGMSREVFLDGEAFFEVTENKQSEFVVNANGLSTKVYGTEFNVNSYKEDDIHEVVLVSGSIGVKKDSVNSEELMLKPNEKASLNDNGGLYRESIDVSGYIAWIDGVLIFENERLENILRKLERHYDVSIKNNYAAINNNRYTGYFDIESVDEILKTFSKHKPFVYEVNGNKITINP
ncbi:MAG: FecR family protein, partial [Allomuricauda sp.]